MTAAAEPVVPRDASRVLRSDGLVVLVVAVATSLPLFWDLTHGVTQDTWLALLAGHEVAAHGLPMHNGWTVFASGHRWVDQQWLGQLVFAGLNRLGGLRLVLLACAVAEAIALLSTVVYARRSGASARATAWVALLALPELSALPRTQTLVFPLFALLLILLSRDSRAPGPRVLFALPVLALWANVHGSVVLAAALVSIHGLLAWKGHRRLTRGLLTAGPWACVLASPYAVHLPHYYDQTLLNGDLATFVVEWQPTQLTLLTVPFFALAALAVFLAGRAKGRLTWTESALLLVTGIAALLAFRSMVWFALTAGCLLPALLQRTLSDRRPIERVDRILGLAGLVVLAGMVATVAASPQAGLRPYPARAAAAAGRAAGADGRVFATLTYADWLLWREPQLRGRVAFDARLELLGTSQLEELSDVSAGRIALPLMRAYRVFVVDARDAPTLSALRGCGYATALTSRHVDVLVRGRVDEVLGRCGNAVVRRA